MSNAPNSGSKYTPVIYIYIYIACNISQGELAIGQTLYDYAHQLLLKTDPVEVIYDNGAPLAARFDQVETGKLRVFFISLFWRMHSTDRPLFSNFSLGDLEPEYRKATLEKNPLAAPDMEIVITMYHASDTPVLGPVRDEIDGVKGYRFTFSGCSIWVKLDRQSLPSCFEGLSLSSNGSLIVLLSEFSSSPECAALIKLVLKERNR